MRDPYKRTDLGHPPDNMRKGDPYSRTDEGNPVGRTHSGAARTNSGGLLAEATLEALPARRKVKALPEGHIDGALLALKVLEALAVHLKREALPKRRLNKASRQETNRRPS